MPLCDALRKGGVCLDGNDDDNVDDNDTGSCCTNERTGHWSVIVLAMGINSSNHSTASVFVVVLVFEALRVVLGVRVGPLFVLTTDVFVVVGYSVLWNDSSDEDPFNRICKINCSYRFRIRFRCCPADEIVLALAVLLLLWLSAVKIDDDKY